MGKPYPGTEQDRIEEQNFKLCQQEKSHHKCSGWQLDGIRTTYPRWQECLCIDDSCRCPDTVVWSLRFCDLALFCPLKASCYPDPHSYRQTPLSVIQHQPTDFLAIRRISARSYLLRPISDIHYPPPELFSASPSHLSDIHSPPSVLIVQLVGSDD